MTMHHFRYLFGGRHFVLEEQRDLKKFLEYAKTQIQMNALVEKAFARAANAHTWISIAHAFGMTEYSDSSTPITFFHFLFKQYPVLNDHCTITNQFFKPSNTFYLTISMYFFQYQFGHRDSDVDLDQLHQFLEYAELQIKTNPLIKKAFETAAEAETWILIADEFGITNFSTPITFFHFLFKQYPVLNKNYTITEQCQCLNTFTVGSRGHVFEIDPEDMVL